MRDLIQNPLWRPEHLGAAIPDSPHAVSVCLPTWRDNIGYEEQEPRVMQRMRTGYPRFVYNEFCRLLFSRCRDRFARNDEDCQAYPSRGAAERCAAWLKQATGGDARVEPYGSCGVYAVCFPRRHARAAMDFWQHTGEGISSRHAEACLNNAPAVDGSEALAGVRRRVAAHAGVTEDDVFLFPCGMNAIYALHRVLITLFPGRKSVQFGFPYVDTLKVQEEFGNGVHFLPRGDETELQRLEQILNTEACSGLYTEFPSNPLLSCPDLQRLSDLSRRHEFPLLVDDTVAGFTNVDLLPAADVVTSSLTKSFSGVGDVTGGSIVLNPRSRFRAELASRLSQCAESVLWGADAVVLERNSRDFAERVRRINVTGEACADYLRTHPRVSRVFYPKFETRAEYDRFRKAGGGYGGLLSLTLVDEPDHAPRFFDSLRVSKGPNLGTNYSLVCPYTILAHYRELDFAESCGVSRYLIRISVGLEEPDDLIGRFRAALDALD